MGWRVRTRKQLGERSDRLTKSRLGCPTSSCSSSNRERFGTGAECHLVLAFHPTRKSLVHFVERTEENLDAVVLEVLQVDGNIVKPSFPLAVKA